MEDSIVFYHFSTREAYETNASSLKNSDIVFCKETRTIITHGEEYCDFSWQDIPEVAGN